MHKIDSDGATLANLFTEGNPALSIPATVVSAAIANAWQQEIVNVIEGVGIPLLTSGTDTFDQLNAAIKELIKRGGIAAPITQNVNNNQASAADVTNFPQFDGTVVKAIECLVSIERRTDSNDVREVGRLYLVFNPETGLWEAPVLQSFFGDAGVVFIATQVLAENFKLQYTSTNLAGASYAGEIRITDIKEVQL